MARNTIGPTFHTGDTTTLADGTRVHSIYANGKAPLNGGGANGVPLGRLIGRVWSTDGYGWVAAPMPVHLPDGRDSWANEVARSIRHFRTKREASMFLYGYANGVGATRSRDAIIGTPLDHAV